MSHLMSLRPVSACNLPVFSKHAGSTNLFIGFFSLLCTTPYALSPTIQALKVKEPEDPQANARGPPNHILPSHLQTCCYKRPVVCIFNVIVSSSNTNRPEYSNWVAKWLSISHQGIIFVTFCALVRILEMIGVFFLLT